MIRSIVTGLLGLISVVAIATLPAACQSGGLGDACTPEEEYSPQFAGFKVTEENIESRSFQCQTRICLVNHFQGRVSCPLGQALPSDKVCNKPGDSCGDRGTCVEAATLTPECDQDSDCAGHGGKCNTARRVCECSQATDCPKPTFCDPEAKQCKSYICHKAGDCQIDYDNPEDNVKNNTGKACCVPGTDTPVAAPVCGQCASDSNRAAKQAVYCSCRCGNADGDPVDENFNFCECPDGFVCEEIRKNVGLGDPNITGKYCIKQDTKWTNDPTTCKGVKGYFDPDQCKGFDNN